MSGLMRVTRLTHTHTFSVSLFLSNRLAQTKPEFLWGWPGQRHTHTDKHTQTLTPFDTNSDMITQSRIHTHTHTHSDLKHRRPHEALTDPLGFKIQTNMWLHNHTHTPESDTHRYGEAESEGGSHTGSRWPCESDDVTPAGSLSPKRQLRKTFLKWLR